MDEFTTREIAIIIISLDKYVKLPMIGDEARFTGEELLNKFTVEFQDNR